MAEDIAYSHRAYKHTLPDSDGNTYQVFLVELVAGRVEERGGDRDMSLRSPAMGYHTARGEVAANHYAYMAYEPYRRYMSHLITYTC